GSSAKIGPMTIQGCVISSLVIFLVTSSSSAQKYKRTMTGSAARGSSASGMTVVPDLAQRLAKFRRVQMPFHSAGFTARERRMIQKLVDASGRLEDIFWRQSDPEALTLYQSLGAGQNPKDHQLRHYVWINASRFDLLEQNRPFVGITPMAP